MEGKELTLEDLAAQLQELKSGKTAADGLLALFQEQNDQLKKQNENLAIQNDGLKKAIDKLVTNRSAGSITTDAPALPKIPDNPIFKLDKSKYQILVPACHIPGIGYRTAEDILMDEEAQRALIEMGSFAVKKIS
ncbi:hypothetical protein [Chitinophaga ginsengisegetis]|uniref:hypothetical protein n=1 Tax=Chitinophaga ginsengisegetis TaxID=393003 RepID=UPI000DBA847A|nr:hypothetical protein [Chitinophaga ginsengisegetis]MDR6565465.1 hypothetical protein [Chitinophaga ginsengisegetis]MDR6645193.1 hypothetical protein [Chitinophaga ginsengisegetis]MDR6652215.1 hypothetical protein [Chitinophaga ginsengisegetis]